MKIDIKNCTEKELWEYVASHLENNGLDVVLVGGAVVSIYSKGMYKSGDLDFIVRSFNKEKLPELLKEIGFERTEGRYYKHPECDHLFIEFPTGPIEIAESYNIVPEEKETESGVIKILSPTDCILDRLEQYVYVEYGKPHGERKLLEQAVLVANNQPFDLQKVKDFLSKINKIEIFEEFKSQLAHVAARNAQS